MAQETDIEKYLIKRVKALGGKQTKHVSPGTNGGADRIVKLKGFPAVWIELKRPGKTLEPLQAARAAEWEAVGMLSMAASTLADVERALQRAQLQ